MILSYKSKGILNQVQDDGLFITPVIPVIPDSIRNPLVRTADLFVIPNLIRNPLIRSTGYYHVKS